MIRYARFATPLGGAYATLGDDGLTGIYFDSQRYAAPIAADWMPAPDAPPLRECIRQLGEYFAEGRRSFDLPLAPSGTPFQERVWREIARIPFGATLTYAQLAARVGSSNGARAAGAATGRNPLSIVVPCHRVLGTDGSLTGYAGGLDRKTRLLELEGVLKPQGALEGFVEPAPA